MLTLLENFSTSLLVQLMRGATSMTVSAATMEVFRQHLGAEGFTYLHLTNGSRYEWIKVYAPDMNAVNTVRISRGEFDTEALGFPAGSCLQYRLNANLIREIIADEMAQADEEATGGECGKQIVELETNNDALKFEATEGCPEDPCGGQKLTLKVDMEALLADATPAGDELTEALKKSLSDTSPSPETQLVMCKGGKFYTVSMAEMVAYVNSCRGNQ